MAKLLIQTQTHENYGDDVNQYWKPKGGCDYVVKKFRGGDEEATKAIFCLRTQIECDNEHIRESIINWEVVADDYLTEFEQSQLDYEGTVRYPAKELAW